MLHFHTENPTNPDSAKPLLAFKPRQLLLAEHSRRIMTTSASSMEEKTGKIASLTPESKQILHHSIVHYLHRNGFSKTLKRFQSEAQIQNDTWKDSSLHLEDIFAKYMNGCNSDAILTSKKPESGNEFDEAIKNDIPKADETSTKKKREDVAVTEAETKPKKKKKSKRDSNSPVQTEQPVVDAVNRSEIDGSTKKPKNKKKKGTQQEQDDEKPEPCKEKKKKKKSAVETEDQAQNGVEAEETKKDGKSSKKRKRVPSDENGHLSTQTESVEESKRQKTEASKGTYKESVVAGESEINAGEKSGSQKSARKQPNGSAEPKTINAFQRVKIDQVEFAHEKLQDNSYWAKDGAEIGYGAKAQEVLGQVRGRDFRHEKTKKKRGSYRGGLIDLQSHSIKFDYSDED